MNGLYQVSNLGRVLSLGNSKHRKNKILKPEIRQGYYSVDLCKNGKRKKYRIHKLVAKMFIENPEPDKFNMINYKDQNKLNNNVNNLEWCTAKYNSNYGRPPKLIKEKLPRGRKGKPIICTLTGKIYSSASEAERKTGIKHICEVCSHTRYSTGGMGWEWY